MDERAFLKQVEEISPAIKIFAEIMQSDDINPSVECPCDNQISKAEYTEAPFNILKITTKMSHEAFSDFQRFILIVKVEESWRALKTEDNWVGDLERSGWVNICYENKAEEVLGKLRQYLRAIKIVCENSLEDISLEEFVHRLTLAWEHLDMGEDVPKLWLNYQSDIAEERTSDCKYLNNHDNWDGCYD